MPFARAVRPIDSPHRRAVALPIEGSPKRDTIHGARCGTRAGIGGCKSLGGWVQKLNT